MNNNTSASSSNAELSGDDASEIKMKNVVQTELLVNLREIILKLANHFELNDPEHYNKDTLNLSADYSIDSHSKDYERYMDNTKERQFKVRFSLFQILYGG